MTITLAPDLESYVADQIDAGVYTDADAVLREAIKALEARENDRKLAELRAMIAEGEADIAAGRCREFTKEVADEIMAKARANYLAKSRGE